MIAQMTKAIEAHSLIPTQPTDMPPTIAKPAPISHRTTQPAVPSLLAHIDLITHASPSCLLMAHTALPPASEVDRAQQRSFGQSYVTQLASDSTGEGEPSKKIVQVVGNRCRIKKPEGEAGRPGRGGYTLKQAVGVRWDAAKFERIQVGRSGMLSNKTHHEPRLLLRTSPTISWISQNPIVTNGRVKSKPWSKR